MQRHGSRLFAAIALLLLCGIAGPVVAPAFAQAPPSVPALPDAERRTRYTITSQTGPFDVGFAVYGDGTDYANWIEVWLDGTKLTATTDWTLGVTSGSLSTLARPITNAQVTLTSARTGVLDIVSARRPRRLSQLTENRGVTARDFNQLYTDVIAMQREGWDLRSRVLQVPPGETVSTIPNAATRASRTLGFDALGGLTTYTAASAVTASDNVTWMQSVTGAVARTVQDKLRERRSLQDFGACKSYADCGGQDDTTAIQKAWTWAATGAGGLEIIDIGGCYKVTSAITAPVPSGSFSVQGIGRPCIQDTGTGAATLNLGTPTQTITNLTNNGSGLIRVTVGSTANYTTGQTKIIDNVGGSVPANGSWTITLISATQFDLQGSTFSGTYSGGGYAVSPNSAQTLIENILVTTNTQANGIRLNGMTNAILRNVQEYGYSGIAKYMDATYGSRIEYPRTISNGTGIKFFHSGGNSSSVTGGIIAGNAGCGIEYDSTDHVRPSISFVGLEVNDKHICLGGASPSIIGNEMEASTTADIYGPSNSSQYRRGVSIIGNFSNSATVMTLTEIEGLTITGNRFDHVGTIGTLTNITSLHWCANGSSNNGTVTGPTGLALSRLMCVTNADNSYFAGFIRGTTASNVEKYLFSNNGADSYVDSPLIVGGSTSTAARAKLDVRGTGRIDSYVDHAAIAAPSTPGSGVGRAYIDSTTKALVNKDDAGTVHTTVVPDAGASNNFLTGVTSAGAITKARPTCANLSDSGAFCSGTDAASLTGTVASARLSGAYTGITAVGAGAVTNSMLNTSTGELGGVWNSTTCTLTYSGGTTNPTTQTCAARYTQIGKILHVHYLIFTGTGGDRTGVKVSIPNSKTTVSTWTVCAGQNISLPTNALASSGSAAGVGTLDIYTYAINTSYAFDCSFEVN